MKNAVYWVVTLLALAFNLVSLYDLYGAMTDLQGHLAGYPPAFVEMVANFPEWRRILWTTTVFIGVIGAAMLVLRRRLAERALWAATALLLLAIVLDYALLDGANGYGPQGAIFNAALIAVEGLFALYARWAARHGLLR